MRAVRGSETVRDCIPVRHATTRELRVLTDMMRELDAMTPEQAELLYVIEDELSKRGKPYQRKVDTAFRFPVSG